MEWKRYMNIFLEIFSWILFIILLISLVWFVKEVWNNYVAKKTNDRVYTMKKTEFEHPTITLCFEPQVNASALRKYNLSLNDILNAKRNPNLNVPKPFINFVNEIGFRIGQNVELNLQLANRNGKNIEIAFSEENSYNSSKYVKLQEIIGIYHGICTVVYINEDIKAPVQGFSQIDLKFKGPSDDLPMIKLHFTSANNSHGAFWQRWLEGENSEILINPSEDSRYYLNLRQEYHFQYQETSGCSQNIGYYECISERYELIIEYLDFSHSYFYNFVEFMKNSNYLVQNVCHHG